MGTRESFGPPDSQTVHLCVDMQRLFAPGGIWAAPWLERVLPIVAAVVARAPERTVFTRFIPPLEPEDLPGTWQGYYRRWRDVTRANLDPTMLELVPELARFVPPATIHDKLTYSAFSPGLVRFLREKSVTGLIVSGTETDACVLATVMAAVDYGLRVYLLTDAVCSSSDEGHDALIGLYTRRFGHQIRTLTAQEALETWMF